MACRGTSWSRPTRQSLEETPTRSSTTPSGRWNTWDRALTKRPGSQAMLAVAETPATRNSPQRSGLPRPRTSTRSLMFAVADAWQRIGIRAQPVGIPLSRARDREYRATFPGFDLSGGVGGDVGWLQRLYSSQAPVPENRFTGRNKARNMDASFDALIDQFFTTVPRAERLFILGEIVHHISDQVVTIGLFYSAEPIMVANRLRNVSSSRTNLAATSWNAHE